MDAHATDELQPGTVTRLNREAGFGYVSEDGGGHNYIFVVGKAITHRDAGGLFVGKKVRFRVSGIGRVDELSVA